MKHKILVVNSLIVLIAVALMFYGYSFRPSTTAYAKPPKPTATINSYLPPMQAQVAYPMPTMYAPTPVFPSTLDEIGYDPDDPDPEPGVPYVWGYFVAHHNGQTYRAVWIMLQGVGENTSLNGQVCMQTDPPRHVFWDCKVTLFMEYYPQTDTNLYFVPFFGYCDVWFYVVNAQLGGVGATIREPNRYFDMCVYIPSLRRG